MDLYVQHMDETMGTNIHKTHPRNLKGKLRSRRSPKETFKFGHIKKQRLDIDDDWWINRKISKKSQPRPILKSDGLSFPNLNEKNGAQNHEMVKDNREIETREGLSISINRKEAIENVREVDLNSEIEMIEDTDDGHVSEVLKKNWRNPKKYQTVGKPDKFDEVITSSDKGLRERRSVKGVNFTRNEILDNDGDVVLEWDHTDDEIVTFRVTAKTLGYVGVGFNDKNHMKGADILVAWVDDHSGAVNLMVSICLKIRYFLI